MLRKSRQTPSIQREFVRVLAKAPSFKRQEMLRLTAADPNLGKQIKTPRQILCFLDATRPTPSR